MSESFFALSRRDKRAALRIEHVAGAPAPIILEKDIWVVWALRALYATPFGQHLTFKGGTSLAKVHHAIDRFSEDVDITVDIRYLVPHLLPADRAPLPRTRSEADRWKKDIARSLQAWIESTALPAMQLAAERAAVAVTVRHTAEQIIVEAEYASDDGLINKAIQVEFGGRATGEPHHHHPVTCDLAAWRPELAFPSATVQAMDAERTFWEKATAVHVFCQRTNLKAARLARHWFDLVKLDACGIAERAVANRQLGADVAEHKQRFFREKDADGREIDYSAAINGGLRLVPLHHLSAALATDYQQMVQAQMFLGEPLSFDALMERCGALEQRINQAWLP